MEGEGLGRVGGRRVAIAPSHLGRQRHQDRFGAAVGAQAKQRAAIEYQVELHIAAAAIELKIALALAVVRRLAFLHDGQVGRHEGIPDGAQQREALLEAAGAEWETEVAGGEPSHVLVDRVENYACDAVVMGAGPLALALLQHCPVPVTVVREVMLG